MNPGEQLCLACGLCCDGSLFDNVRLGRGDDAARLKTLGLPVKVSRARIPVTHFRQPCAGLCADRTCRLYTDRPGQCRTFECRVYQDAHAGRITFTAARRLVRQTRRQAEEIRRLLVTLGDHDDARSLSDRFRRTQQRLEAGEGDAQAHQVFAELSQAVHRFKLLAHDKFYPRVAAAEKAP